MSSPGGVHSRIHSLRGEQFRHLQNLRGSRSHLSSTNIHTVPPLPARLLSIAGPSLDLIPDANAELPPPLQVKYTPNDDGTPTISDGTSFRPPAGPPPPKGWTLTSQKDIKKTALWRAEALSLILNHLVNQPPASFSTSAPSSGARLHAATRSPCPPRIPSLSLLCLQIFLRDCSLAEFQDEIVPCIPPHLRKDLIRFTAVHSPLNTARLHALWAPAGHADGEMIVVGPDAMLRDDYFIRSSSGNGNGLGDVKEPKDWDWDMDEKVTNPPLHSFVLLTTSLSSSTLSSFPPTLTSLALINISAPVQLHRLPNICPLIVILDLSYNAWLGVKASDGQGGPTESQPLTGPTVRPAKVAVDLGRIDWFRWGHLKVLGLRGNYVPTSFVGKVNEGRWDDIEVVL